MAQKKQKRENLERTERTQERTKPLFPPTFQALSKYYWRELLTVDEMSKALGVSTKTGYQLLRENKIEHLKVGRAYKVPKAHLLSYLRLGLRNAEN